MNPTAKPTRFDGSFACVAVAWQAHDGELLGFLRHQLPDGRPA
jgi:fructose 1,6-bisphosphatase